MEKFAISDNLINFYNKCARMLSSIGSDQLSSTYRQLRHHKIPRWRFNIIWHLDSIMLTVEKPATWQVLANTLTHQNFNIFGNGYTKKESGNHLLLSTILKASQCLVTTFSTFNICTIAHIKLNTNLNYWITMEINQCNVTIFPQIN